MRGSSNHHGNTVHQNQLSVLCDVGKQNTVGAYAAVGMPVHMSGVVAALAGLVPRYSERVTCAVHSCGCCSCYCVCFCAGNCCGSAHVGC